jgi:hypothetical protein
MPVSLLDYAWFVVRLVVLWKVNQEDNRYVYNCSHSNHRDVPEFMQTFEKGQRENDHVVGDEGDDNEEFPAVEVFVAEVRLRVLHHVDNQLGEDKLEGNTGAEQVGQLAPVSNYFCSSAEYESAQLSVI